MHIVISMIPLLYGTAWLIDQLPWSNHLIGVTACAWALIYLVTVLRH